MQPRRSDKGVNVMRKTEKQNNEVIKDLMKKNKVPQWKLAKALNVCENTVGRALRSPLEEELFNLYMEKLRTLIPSEN